MRAFLRVGAGGHGEPGLKVRRSGRARAGPAAGPGLRAGCVVGREPQAQVAGVADQPALGDGDQRPAQGGDHGLAAARARTRCPPRRAGTAVQWCSQAAMLAARSAPHAQVHLGISGGRCGGRRELAVVEDVLHRGAVTVPVLGGHRLVRGGDVQVGQDERVGVIAPARASSGNGRALVRVQGAAPPGPAGRRKPGAGSSSTSSAAFVGHGQYSATATWAPCRSCCARRPRRSRPAAAAAARSARADREADLRGRRGPVARRDGVGAPSPTRRKPARSGRLARARRSSPGAVARGSSVPSPRSAASTISASAQLATCGRPTRWPWWL